MDVQQIRSWFPSLDSPTVFLDNAGGSQVPRGVAEAVANYYQQSYAQLGGSYRESQIAVKTVADAHVLMARWCNAHSEANVILGPSDTALTRMLTDAYIDAGVANGFADGRDEIVVSPHGHESNVGPWVRMGKFGWKVKMWNDLPVAGEAYAKSLGPLISSRTRLVVFPHVSNILGSVVNAKSIIQRAHAVGARVVVDGVAYAPHRALDIRALGADWYSWSTYKVMGPHMAVLAGTPEAMGEVTGPNHYFIDPGTWPKKFELGGVSHEGCAGLLGVQAYMRFLAGGQGLRPGAPDQVIDRGTIERAWAEMERHELVLQKTLIDGLRAIPGIRIIGPVETDETRVPTVCFVVEGASSKAVAEKANREGLAMRFGHFYSLRLLKTVLPERDPEDGVVRISLVHYNTVEEVERAVEWVRVHAGA